MVVVAFPPALRATKNDISRLLLLLRLRLYVALLLAAAAAQQPMLGGYADNANHHAPRRDLLWLLRRARMPLRS